MTLTGNAPAIRTYAAKGIIEEINATNLTVVIKHEAVSNYMAAMTMPFKVRTPAELANRVRGDAVTFQLHVSDSESWVDHLVKIGSVTLPPEPVGKPMAAMPAERESGSALDYSFTNELGQAVRLNDFRGQALAVTFFYTRCPLPDFCPRLSKNFQVASQKLAHMPNAPTNWHFISISFDSEFDSPAMLRAYGETYQYDPAHWSFLTGPQDKIAELARECGVTYESDNGTYNHNFRTLIVDANSHLQYVFITGGDLSDQIVSEMLKAAAVTSQTGPAKPEVSNLEPK